MFDTPTLKLLQAKLPALPVMVMEGSLARDVDDLLAGVAPRAHWAVVDDPNTRQALGERVFKAVQKHNARHVMFEASPIASDEAVEYVRRQSKDCDALAAVGTGGINDICKYAAHLDNKPYVVFPTAASMNGYLSANASITVQGYKKTCAAKMPLAAFCDMSVIAGAPARLSISGFGDSLARPTAQADWLMSHLLLGTAYDDTPFQLLAPYEPQLLAEARGIARQDKNALTLLMKTLLLSGLGMTIAGGSYPASQAEHMIAHAMGMLCRHPGGSRDPAMLHGEEIAVTALYMTELQERLLHTMSRPRRDAFPEEKIRALFGEKVVQEAKKAFAIKEELVKQCRDRSDLAEKIAPVLIPSPRLRGLLEAAEAPMEAAALGWNPGDYQEVAGIARFLRERFTFLDIE